MPYNLGRLIGASGITSSNTNSSGIFYASEVPTLIENLSFDAKDHYWKRFINKKGGLTNTWGYWFNSDTQYGLRYDPYANMHLSTDGSSLFILRRSTAMAIDQYKMNTANDVSTMYYYGSFHIKGPSSQAETDPYAFTFNNDGTKIFIHGISLDDLFSYELTTAWDIKTLDITTLARKVDWETGYIFAMSFNNDGTKLFTADQVDDTIREHTLSTPYDITTISDHANGIKLSDYAAEPQYRTNASYSWPFTVQFNNDGTRLFTSYRNNEQRIFEYALTTAYDLTTASLHEVHSLGSWENYGHWDNFVISNDGQRLITICDGEYFFSQYDLQVPWDLQSSPWQDFHILERISYYSGLDVNPSANTGWYTIGEASISTRTNLIEFKFQTPGDANTIFLTGREATLGGAYYAYVSTWANNGQYLFAVSRQDQRILRYEASTPYDLATLSGDFDQFYIGSEEANPVGVAFNDTGSKMYVSGYSDDGVNEYTLTTNWDITTASYSSGPHLVVSGQDARDFQFNNDGTKAYYISFGSDNVYEWTLGTAYDTSSNTADPVLFSVYAEERTPTGLAFKGDGTKMYVTGASYYEIHGYDLSTAWDISTATFAGESPDHHYVHGLYIANTGQYMFVSDYDQGRIYRVKANSNNIFDSSANTDMYLDVSAQSANPQDVHFKPDGTEMFVLQYNDQYIDKYTLSSAWDISTATYDSTSTSLTPSTGLRGFTMTEDGTKLFTVSTTADDIHRFDLSTAFDVNTAVKHSGELYVYDGDYSGLQISKDGKRLYTCSRNYAKILQFNLDTAYDLSTANNEGVVLNHSSYLDPDLGGLAFTNSGNAVYVTSMGAGHNAWTTDWKGDATVPYKLETNWDLASAKPIWVRSAHINDYGTTNTQRGVAPTSDGGIVISCDENPGASLYWFDGENRDISANTDIYPSDRPMTGTVPNNLAPQYQRIKAFIDVGLYVNNIYDINWGKGGYKFYILGYGEFAAIQEFDCSKAYDITTLSFVRSLNLETSHWINAFGTTLNPASVQCFTFDQNGNYLYIAESGPDIVAKYDLSVPWNISSGTAAGYVDITTPESSPRSIFWNKAGDQLYVVGTSSDKINVFKTTSPYSVNNATYTAGDQFEISPRVSDVYNMKMTPDFTKVVYHDYYYYTREAAIGSANGTINSITLPVGNTNYNTDLTQWTAYLGTSQTGDGYAKGIMWNLNGSAALSMARNSSTTHGMTVRYMNFPSEKFVDDYGAGGGIASNLTIVNELETGTENSYGQNTDGVRFNPQITTNLLSMEVGTRSTHKDGNGPLVWWCMPMSVNTVSGRNGGDVYGGRQFGLWNAGGDKKVDEFCIFQKSTSDSYAGPYRVYSSAYNYSSSAITFTNGGNRHGLSFKRDGTKIYTSDTSGVFYENNLSTAWKIDTIDSLSTPVGSFSTGIYYRGFDIDNDGVFLFATQDSSVNLDVYELLTPWDITTMVFRVTLAFPVNLGWNVCAREKNVTVTAEDWTTSTPANQLVMFLDYSSLD